MIQISLQKKFYFLFLQKDLFSIAADNLMSSFTPSIYQNQYSIQFVPVVDKDQQYAIHPSTMMIVSCICYCIAQNCVV